MTMRILICSSLLALWSVTTNSLGCTIFNAATNGMVLVGNEEDWEDKDAIVQVHPSSGRKYGRIYFGFGKFKYIPFGGINSKGLFFDVCGLPEKKEVVGQFPTTYRTYRTKWGHSLYELMLENCATVEEAIRFLKKRNTISLKWGHIMIVDRSGDSAIVEWGKGQLAVHRKKGHSQVLTNFNLTDPSWRYGSYPCLRYDAATRGLQDKKRVSIKQFVNVLNSVHLESAVYSNIYDLQRGEIYVFHKHEMSKYIKIDIRTVLSKGRQTHHLAKLFKSYAVHSVVNLN